ncbi:hypothetical protein BDV29DRAFT_200413 [Aspergillus leporis]|uniref:Uncharacterized protein n=1 Tax=Aspergillus leporis TaxID=41062 RepID=A0A5N5WGR0_9EURO|nr:hypothetical protein BDV29DRAFT_200413 [Aspergillus leporis]
MLSSISDNRMDEFHILDIIPEAAQCYCRDYTYIKLELVGRMNARSLVQDGPQSSAPTFHFLRVAGNNVAGDAATRRRVLSHAMVDNQRRNRQPKQYMTSIIELGITPLLDGSRPLSLPPQQRDGAPLTLLDASRSDPFGTFPLDSSHRSRQLWDHMYDGSCVMFRTMLDIGFLDVVRESIALSQLLSTSSRHLGHLHGNDNEGDCHRYTIKATNLLQQRLRHPFNCATNEVAAAVLAFCCDANIRRDSELVDIYGAYLQDSVPWYPQPFAILAARSQLTLIRSIGSAGFEMFQSLQNLNKIMQAELRKRNLEKDVIFPGFHISPILHVLLSSSPGSVYDGVDMRIKETSGEIRHR